MNGSYPGESAEYRAARDRLLEPEAPLRRLTEDVAAARRALPPGGVVPEDYVSEEAGPTSWPGQDPRHSDTIDPLWNLFDLTPAGRGSDWHPELSYD